jgi:major membrane immunogen (membrane-anchored lipoprotein)
VFKLITMLILALILLSTCASPDITPAPLSALPNSGLEGQVLIGPTCAGPARVGSNCEDQPFQAVITVNSPKGERIVQIQTNKEGRFKIPLAPGEYILHPESPSVMPFAGEQTVTVEIGKFTQVVVNYDSGIR